LGGCNAKGVRESDVFGSGDFFGKKRAKLLSNKCSSQMHLPLLSVVPLHRMGEKGINQGNGKSP